MDLYYYRYEFLSIVFRFANIKLKFDGDIARDVWHNKQARAVKRVFNTVNIYLSLSG